MMISALVWLSVFLVGLLLEGRFYPIKDEAFIAWMTWFMVTWLIFFLFSPVHIENNRTIAEIRKIPFDYTWPLILLIGWLVYKIWVIGYSGPEHFFFNLRLAATGTEGISNLGLIERFYPLIFALFLFEHIYARRENIYLRILLWCFMLLYAMASMSKLAFLTPISSWVIIQGISGRLKVRKIVILAPIVFAAIMSLHFLRAAISNRVTIEDLLAIYIYSPLVALGYMDIDDQLPLGTLTLRFFYVIASYLDIMPIPSSTLGYTAVPELTNVYTVMGPFYYDFGLIGVFGGAAFYGLLFSYLFIKSMKGSGLGLLLFSGYSIALLMQSFSDVLMIFLSYNLQLLIYGVIVFLASRKVLYGR